MKKLINFLIDECLSFRLVDVAVKYKYSGSTHVNWRGMRGSPDHKVMKFVLAEDWTFVTTNIRDFRPDLNNASTRPCYSGIELHAGLVCVHLPFGSDLEIQLLYFEEVLGFLRKFDDLVNKIVDIRPSDNLDDVYISITDYPATE